MTRFALPLVLALAVLGARPAAAQQEPLESGARVRLTVPISVSPGRVIGTLTSADSARLVVNVTSSGEQLEIPRSLVSRLEVSRGHISSEDATRQSALRGARSGAIFAGGVTGAFFGAARLFGEKRDGDVEASITLDKHPLYYVAVTAGGGAVIGALAGAVFGGNATEQWETVETGRLALHWDGGREVGLALSF